MYLYVCTWDVETVQSIYNNERKLYFTLAMYIIKYFE